MPTDPNERIAKALEIIAGRLVMLPAVCGVWIWTGLVICAYLGRLMK